jgi:hypothetical protein
MCYEVIRPMDENEAKKRELVVTAFVQKNNLIAEVSKLEHYIRDLETKASTALESGDKKLVSMLFDEKHHYEQALDQMRKNLLTATDLTERMKAFLREEKPREKERVRVILTPLTEDEMKKKCEALAQKFALGTKEDTKKVASAQNLLTEMQDLRVHLEKLEGAWLEYEMRHRTRQEVSLSSGNVARFSALIARLLGKR